MFRNFAERRLPISCVGKGKGRVMPVFSWHTCFL